MGQFIPMAISLAGAAAQNAETKRVARKQDEQDSMALLNQQRKQQKADRKVNEEVTELEGSDAQGERAERLDAYMQGLARSRRGMESGTNPAFGSGTFKADAAEAGKDVQQAGADNAALVARMDAPGLQRQNEQFGYGRLATDLGLIGRESQGQRFIDELRMRAIRRRPEVDFAAGALGAAGGAMGGQGGYSGSAGQQPYMNAAPTAPSGAAWTNAYGAGKR